MGQAIQQSTTATISAVGESPLWTATTEEMPDGGWLLELESPTLYLTVKLHNRSTLREAEAFLRAASTLRIRSRFQATTDEFVLGYFGQTLVSLLRDDEDFVRCFLLIGPQDCCSLRVSLDEAEINALADAVGRAGAE